MFVMKAEDNRMEIGMQHKVSVVIPVYNVKQYLSECVNSVINQTYQNMEIILVDDGSTDGSGALCDEYAKLDERIKVFHKENGGLSDARNYGMDRADGEFIYFLDSDDFIEPYAIEALTETAVQNEADVVLLDARVIDEDGSPQMDLPSYMRYYRIGNYEGCVSGKELFRKMQNQGEYRSGVPFHFIRREAIKYRFASILHEDELFTMQLLYSVDKAVYYPEVLYVRRIRAGSITTVSASPKHYLGVKAVITELAKIPEFDVAIATRIGSMYVKQQLIYAGLSKEEKKIVYKEKKSLDDFIVRNHYFGNSKLRSSFYKCNFPGYIVIKKHIEGTVAKLVNKLQQSKQYKKQLANIKNIKDTRRIFVIGTPRHGNLGDHAIAIAEEHFIKDVLPEWRYIEIEMPFYKTCKKAIKKLVRPEDLMIVSGGGWMGNQWFHNELVIREIVQTYRRNAVMIFPQTIYYEPSENTEKQMADAREIYSGHPNLLMALRDKKSYLFAKENGFGRCIYVPDIALYEKRDSFELSRDGVLICKRYDCEKCVSDETWENVEVFLRKQEKNVRYTTTIIKKISAEGRKAAFDKKLLEFARAELVVTDRLHAMIFAAITGTPCVAFDNTSKKVSGVYEWLAGLSYVKCAADAQQAQKEISALLNQASKPHVYEKPDFAKLKDALASAGKENV